jgi:hypothetical protein
MLLVKQWMLVDVKQLAFALQGDEARTLEMQQASLTPKPESKRRPNKRTHNELICVLYRFVVTYRT